MKKLIVFCMLIIIVFSAVVLTAAGARGATDKVTLTFMSTPMWSGVYSPNEPGADVNDFHKFVAEKYMDQNPNVTINYETIAGPERDEQINIMLAAGDPPDIFFDAHFVLLDLAHRGALVPLDDIYDDQTLQDYPDHILDAVTIGGQKWHVPFFQTSAGFFSVNVDLFRKAGALEHTQPENTIIKWTPEEFKAAMEAVSVLDVYPYVAYASVNGDTWNNVMLRMYGADFFTPDGKEVIIDSPEGIKAFEFLREIYDEGLTAPSPETLNGHDALHLFDSQQAAISRNWHGRVKETRAAMERGDMEEFEIKLAFIPGITPMTFSYYQGSIVFDSGDQARIDAAKDFVKFYSTQEEYYRASLANTPVRKSLSNEIDDEELLALAQADVDHVDFFKGVPGYVALRHVLFPEFQALYTGEKTPRRAIEDFARSGTRTLQRSWEDSVLR